jgi:hypothetical protein
MILLLVIAGFGLLAAGTYRQSAAIFGDRPPLRTRATLLVGGYLALGISLVLVGAGPDPARQLVQWVGLLTVGALVMLVGCWLRAPR